MNGTDEAEPLSASLKVGYAILCVGLVVFGGLMSGLTLGLLTLDRVELEARARGGACGARCGRACVRCSACCGAREGDAWAKERCVLRGVLGVR
jgi:hypothetical protein